jgi:hypothetical protein
MAYRVFLSHSSQDKNLVMALARLLEKFGVEFFVAEWYLSPGERLDKKVLDAIRGYDCMVVLLTPNGMRSNWVHQEIGAALQAGKPVIPIVEKGTGAQDLAALNGREYIEYDPHQPEQALTKAAAFVGSLKPKKDRQQAALVAGAIVAFLLLLWGSKS